MRSSLKDICIMCVLICLMCSGCNASTWIGTSEIHDMLFVTGQTSFSPVYVLFTNVSQDVARGETRKTEVRDEPQALFSQHRTVLINDEEVFSYVVTRNSLVINNQTYLFDQGHVFTVETVRDTLNISQLPIKLDGASEEINWCKFAKADAIREFHKRVGAEISECID